jgi:tRNA 2-selenouridine synthase
MERVPIEQFLRLMETHPVFDVRTPKEYQNGHIPGAINLPLFTNEERAVIGTTYKRSGKDKAVFEGLDIVGPKMRWIAETIRKKSRKSGTALIHCWRGGMRSESVAWLAGFCGINTVVLEKGYKAYRTWCIEQFSAERSILILGGRTGSGKTEILHHLEKCGEQVLDLEGLANHKGSTYGALGEEAQPYQEMFENLLAAKLAKTDPVKRMWIEDESLHIGRCCVPDAFWPKMRDSGVVAVDVSLNRRISFLLGEYGSFNPDHLVEATKKIEKRFGHERTQECIKAIERGDITEAVRISLEYYDRMYDFGLSKREEGKVLSIPVSDDEPLKAVAEKLSALE